MADLSLKDALSLFKQGVQDFSRQRSINEANDAVQQIRESQLDETAQRKQLQDVAAQLQGTLLGIGESPGVATSAARTIAPAPEPAITALQERELGLKSRGLDIQEKALGEKAKKLKPLSTAELQVFTDADISVDSANELLGRLKDVEGLIGPILGRTRAPVEEFFDSAKGVNFAEFQADTDKLFLKFKKFITGVAAGKLETKQLERTFPRVTDPPAVFKRKMEAVIKQNQRLRRSHLATLKRGGRDVTDFEDTAIPVKKDSKFEKPLSGAFEF